jgi:ribonuclease BN (tRNA processing enzyme)
VPLFLPGNRIDIYGPPNPVSMKGIKEALAVQMEYSYFPVRQSELKSTIRYLNLTEGQSVTVGPATVTTTFTNHTVLNFGYRVETEGAGLFYTGDHEPFRNIYSPDNERFAEYEARVQAKEDHLATFITGCRALVADAQYTEQEYVEKVGWGHSTFDRSVRLALKAGVERLYLIHHDPTRTDDELEAIYADLVHRYRHEPLDIRLAADGDSFDV